MKSKHKIFIGALMASTLAIVIEIVQRQGLNGSVGPLGWVLLGTVVYTEVMQMFYDEQISMSLSGPVLILAVHTQPFWFVVLLAVICTMAGKFFQTYYYHEQERVFDVKLVFNTTQYVLMVSLVSLLFGGTYAYEVGGLLHWTLASVFYTVVNLLLTGMVITLYRGQNGFTAYRSKSTLLFMYFHAAITLLLIYTYDLGGIMGCLLAFLVLIPMQGEILQRASIHKLNPMLIQDELTGAFNRGFMKRKITEWLHHEKAFALLFMDLDEFKTINDTHGHVVGDEILIHFVEEVQKDLRKEDRIFRFGGDEFCVLFQNADDARKVHARWKGEWLQFISADDSTISYTFSSGIIEHTKEEEMTFFELLDRVDRQMYEEKRHKAKMRSMEIS
jgi:diguanylate cyclase (GGDEF)-like protein